MNDKELNQNALTESVINLWPIFVSLSLVLLSGGWVYGSETDDLTSYLLNSLLAKGLGIAIFILGVLLAMTSRDTFRGIFCVGCSLLFIYWIGTSNLLQDLRVGVLLIGLLGINITGFNVLYRKNKNDDEGDGDDDVE